MADLIKTQHFTKQYDKILQNINFFPEEAIDPFAGDCDLKKYSPNTKWTFYDIEPKNSEVIKNDSLLNPIDYTNKTVITNPPYLAKNKTKEFKEIFAIYNVDDLYKAAILSMVNCKNGIFIIPFNFFTDEASAEVRKRFFSKYKVDYVNVFTEPVFENTTYNVCSFYFEQGKTDKISFYNNGKVLNTSLKEEYGYRLGGEFYALFKNQEKLFDRVKTGKEKYITNIFFTALDNRKEKIHLSYNPNIYIGKESDRIFGTLVSKIELSEEKQKELIDKFNNFLNSERDKYSNLILTTYRDFGRKRISLENIYKICSMLISTEEKTKLSYNKIR